MKSIVFILAIGIFVILTITSNYSYAQIDSRNQTKPDREQAAANPDKKKKKDKRKREKNRRLKGKKDKRVSGKNGSGTSGKKIYSNKKQIRRNNRKTDRAKQVERSYKGDITGRKQTKPTDRKREDRTYYQPDPYEYRRIRTEKSRAGPDAPKVRSATKKGEKARTGDISGQTTVRQKSKRSAPIAAYPQPNPYKGRKVKTEKQRAKSNKRQIQSVRSITRPAESRPPGARTKSRAGSVSASARPKVRQKKNVYRNHERTGGEKSTSKDIAGKNLRTRNTRSAIGSSPIPYSSINPYSKRKRYDEGERYRRSGKRYSSARSISRSSESAANRNSGTRYGQHRNRRSIKTTGVVVAKSVRSTSDPRGKGERRIYGNKYSPPPTRSVSRGGESKGPKRPRGYISVSGRRKTYRQRNTYQGKDRHFGENSTNRDIAGRKLRTRNKRSFHPTWAEFGGGTYGSGSVGGKPTKKYSLAGGRRKSRANWNNSGNPVIGRGPGPRGESSYTGRLPLSSMPSYGPSKAATHKGRMPISAISGFGQSQSSNYRGNINAKKLRRYKGGNESLYTGNRKARKRLQGGGSISGFWNNKGNPIVGRGPGPSGESSFTGRMPISAMPSYGPSTAGTYQGNRKGRKPTKGGGSITGAWNNKGNPIVGRGPGPSGESSFTGRMPLSAMPSYGPGKEGVYQGRQKGYKPLKGGGSITGFWNNDGRALRKRDRSAIDIASSGYKGAMPLSAMPSYGDGKEGVYAGNMKAKKRLKGGGGSVTTLWNNNNRPIEGKGPGKYDVGRFAGNMPLSSLPGYGDGKEGSYQGNIKRKQTKIGQSDGTERGRTKSLTFLRIGDPNQMGLNHQEKHLKVKNDLPKELSRSERQRISDSQGLGRGRTRSLSFLSLGDPTQGGLHAELGNKKHKNDLPSEIRGKNRLRLPDSDGMDRGRTRSFTFLKLGDPTHGGLHAETGNRKRKNDLHPDIKGKNKLRLADADGMDNGRSRTFSFWAIGDPTKGGLVRSPAQARGRLHPSADYSKPGHYYNSIQKKEQPVKFKIWFAQLFKKNANQPDAVKEKERRPRYNKTEREIWETSIREDWYKN